MSAWRVGTEIAASTGAAEAQGQSGVVGALEKIARWIPGDVLALYGAAITAFAASSGSRPSVVLLIAGAVFAGLLVVCAAFAKTHKFSAAQLPAAGLAVVAFLIWSLTVPFSGWQRIDWVGENQAVVAVIAAAAAALFALIAEGLTPPPDNG